MNKQVHVDCPTYLELGLKNGDVVAVNGKELNNEGIKHVISYLCNEVDVKVEDVLNKVKNVEASDGAVTLKLFNGAVSAL